jgi:hypothetical protein
MDSDIYFILGIVLLVTVGWLLNLLARIFPPKWVEVLADCEFIGTPRRRTKTYYGIHLLRLSYEFEGRMYVKLASIRYHLRTLEWEVISQPQTSHDQTKLLIRVHPTKPHIIEYQKWLWWHDLLPLVVLGILWGAILTYLHRHGKLPWL